ncbi:FAD:protein FMN transferase [uncultured Ruminococcus sp.]|uniref:FAD:protein FMN transferase n=1 Tax=uncultured Ruminococcus sp. TaxID=165186 RepID=UPI00292CC407|nr:FAD:protein FMN transferase [uncultured Ruminococcus sp.]
MKKRILGALCALILLIAVILSSCASTEPRSASFQSMDTLMTVKVYGGDKDLCDRLQQRVTELDALLDATDENSDIYQLNQNGKADVSNDTAALLGRSLQLSEKLDLAFDITIYPAVKAWGFTTGDYRIPDDDELKKLAAKIDDTAVQSENNTYTLPAGVMLDLGAVAKGYAADQCDAILKEGHVDAAVLNLGGTVKLYGKKPDGKRFSVGVADPDNPAGYFGYLSCEGGVVATSGGYERYFERDGKRYIHILDPATAKPVENGIQSVTICCDDGTAADALSTALFVMGLDKATAYYRAHPDFDFIILTDDHSVYLTEGVYDEFTLCDGYDFHLKKVDR